MFGDCALDPRQGKLPRRIIADFVIAAHAQHHRLSVLTFDDEVYGYFEAIVDKP